ncbi:MAG: SpoIID/LytB domain-containing protein [Myxococcota bacterium]|nr:SpoIID/LytB domain-containing protein [Myxococcota bacterium]
MRRAVLALLLASCAGPGPSSLPVSLTGRLTDAYSGAPVPGARVSAPREGAVALTDARGRFHLEVGPGPHRLRLEADGYLPGERVAARPGDEVEAVVFPRAPDHAAIAAHFATLARPEDAPTERAVTGDAAVEDVGAAVWAHHDGPRLPETIRVWRAAGTALQPRSPSFADRSCDPDAVVEVLPFEEYVKGVIPHEWIPSWDPEALRAGAIAARSYAASHALGGGRWDCADVDDGTVTQVYRDDRAEPTNAAVDATRGQVVVRDGAVVRAEYSAENGGRTEHDVDDPTCAGTDRHGHGRGMCQWGTQRWATGVCANPPCDFGAFGPEPKDHLWMVEHYFPGATASGGPHEVEPCAVLPPEGGVLEESGPCFEAFGPGEYWRFESFGHGGSLTWTNAYESTSPSNWSRFSLFFAEPGRYRVEVYVEPGFGGHTAIPYTITHAGGDERLLFDQRAASGWVTLAELDFDDAGALRVDDHTGGPLDDDRRIALDAVRLTRLDGPGGPDGGAGGARGVGGGPLEARGGRGLGGCAASGRGPGVGWLPALALLALLRRRR